MAVWESGVMEDVESALEKRPGKKTASQPPFWFINPLYVFWMSLFGKNSLFPRCDHREVSEDLRRTWARAKSIQPWDVLPSLRSFRRTSRTLARRRKSGVRRLSFSGDGRGWVRDGLHASGRGAENALEKIDSPAGNKRNRRYKRFSYLLEVDNSRFRIHWP